LTGVALAATVAKAALAALLVPAETDRRSRSE
jgi:hypothetical protein